MYLYTYTYNTYIYMQLSYQYNFVNRFLLLYTMMKLRVHHVHHVPKYMSCHKGLVVITGRAHCFHHNIYVMPILFL